MKPRQIGSLLLAVGLILLALFLNKPRSATPSAPPAETVQRAGFLVRGFGSPSKLSEHYQKHGAEFGARSQDEYLSMALALRDKPAGGDVLELTRGDRVVCRFDRSSGAFLAFDADGTVRTFFKPNDGENYFRRQAKR